MLKFQYLSSFFVVSEMVYLTYGYEEQIYGKTTS